MSSADQQLYNEHVDELRLRYDAVLEQTSYPAVVIAAGNPVPIFVDDQHLPFKANPYLLQWLPLSEHPGSILTYQRGGIPELLVYAPPDYWHTQAPVPAIIDNSVISLRLVSSHEQLLKHVKNLPSRTAFIGETLQREDSLGLRRVNPPKLMQQLDYQRSFKTTWEVDNMRRASAIAAKGHSAAEQSFIDGGSEYDIQSAFRKASKVTDNEMPYPAIVALNEHGATLHYQRLEHIANHGQSLLIDAGVSVNGYASDITRCYSTDAAFSELIAGMHKLQQELCAAAQPGVDYRSLHLAAHHSIAALLKEADLVTSQPEDTVATGVSRAFFPHGLGHFLGLQVHDVGALLSSGAGTETPRPDEDPYLRLTRILQSGNTLTIEPGLYFIDSLLEPLRASASGKVINWKQVDLLRQFGGIRIEDNLHITDAGNENLTREAFSAD